jgi:hypothetical protein
MPDPRRRRLFIGLAAAAVLLVIAVPLAVIVLQRSPRPASSGPPATPDATVTTTPPVASATTPGTPAPDGRIPLPVLKNATLDIPAWPADNLTCLSGRMTFANGEVLSPADGSFYFARHIIVFAATYGDVDGDGAQETLAVIGCAVQGGSDQLVAFDRNAAGSIVTLGTVVATTGQLRAFGTVNESSLFDDGAIKVLANGTIQVQVSDIQNCCGSDVAAVWQARTYGWNGHEFRQTGGPTSFPVNPRVTETSLTVGSLVFGPPVDGVRHGTLTITVGYLYDTPPDHLSLFVRTTTGVEREGSNWPAPNSDGTFTLPTPAKGGSQTYVLGFRSTGMASGGEISLRLIARPRPDANPTSGSSYLAESNPFNNMRLVTIAP